MGLIIKNKKHYLTRIPLGILVCITIGLSPVIIGFIGKWVSVNIFGIPCRGGNCAWDVLHWFALFTIPAGVIAFIIFLVIILTDMISLTNNKRHANK